jgi:hypothetical protein
MELGGKTKGPPAGEKAMRILNAWSPSGEKGESPGNVARRAAYSSLKVKPGGQEKWAEEQGEEEREETLKYALTYQRASSWHCFSILAL